ncbi:MAG: nitrophenyl compound nitroreductase subunit ArsF family protein [Deltaproteobacteria bacterium]|jgi:thioredoxin-related protein|nr:nitrophenyl compound nitroreductase subunit ArsF family protein [Deltaproteobacteria bacterium]
MQKKHILTSLLLVFVAASIGTLIYKQTRPSQKQDRIKKIKGKKLLVLYFHGNKRCHTCINMEKYTREAVNKGFPKKVANGEIEIQTINLDKSGNDHYVSDYDLSSRFVVLSFVEEGKEKQFRRLSKVWKLARNKEKFIDYIQDELDTFYAMNF